MRYVKKFPAPPQDHKDEKKLLERENIEKGKKTSKGETKALMGTHSKKKK